MPVDVPFDESDRVLVVALAGQAALDDLDYRTWLTELRKRSEAADNVEILGYALAERVADQRLLFGGLNRERPAWSE